MKRSFYFLTALAVVALAIWRFSKPLEKHQAPQVASHPSTAGKVSSAGAIVSDSKNDASTKTDFKNSPVSQIKPLVSYKEDARVIADLVAQLPQSKSNLLKMIEKEDLFKASQVEIEEHSVDEITQNQLGAIKVMALRALINAEKSPYKIKQDIDHIIQTAKDPTIVKIAKAARDSMNKGQNFFKDFLDGVDQMPLAN